MCTIASALPLEDTLEEKRNHEEEQEQQEEEGHERQQGEGSMIMPLHDVVRLPTSSPSPPSPTPLPGQLSGPLLDEISSPISAQIFDFCDPDMFSDTLQNSETTSSPNCVCYDQDHNSSYTTNISFPSNVVDNDNSIISNKFRTEPLDMSNFQGDQNDQNANNSNTSSTTTTATTTTPSHHHNHLSIMFDPQDEIDNDISASIDFSPSPPFSAPPPPYNLTTTTTTTTTTQQDVYQLPLAEVTMTNGLSQYPAPVDPLVLPLIGAPPPTLGPVFEEDCLSPIPPFLRLNPSATTATTSSSSSCSFLDPSMSSFLPGNLNHGLAAENSGLFAGSLLMATELQAKELDFQGDNSGIFCTDQLSRYNSGDMQGFSNESSQMVSAATSSAPLATEISSLEDPTFKVGKLSAEQRKEKIHRYMRKRNERNFSKKIKYACRKTLADSRPRVRGRFAKNDDYGEPHRHINGHHDDDDYDEVPVKEEDEMVDSSDIFSHISGVNSFRCNYQIQSWI